MSDPDVHVSEVAVPRAWDAQAAARSALRASAVAWFVPTLLGQWAFAYHIAETYFTAAYAGDFAAWNKRLFVGFVPGDLVGNAALIAHLFIAFVMTIGGTLQLIPQIRRRAPAFHRWNGRVFIVIAIVTSVAGIYMTMTRETFGGILPNDIGVSLNGVLIIVFAIMAMRHAMARRIDVHQRWALRTFMVASGVWFLRMIYTFLDVTFKNVPGIAEDMTGPTNVVINFASYLLPLAILELYLHAKRTRNAPAKFATAALLFAAAGATAVAASVRTLRWLS